MGTKENDHENFLSKFVDPTSEDKEVCNIIDNWVEISSRQNLDFQRTLLNSQENFRKNSKILLSRYELFHLCLSEILYQSKKIREKILKFLKKSPKYMNNYSKRV